MNPLETKRKIYSVHRSGDDVAVGRHSTPGPMNPVVNSTAAVNRRKPSDASLEVIQVRPGVTEIRFVCKCGEEIVLTCESAET